MNGRTKDSNKNNFSYFSQVWPILENINYFSEENYSLTKNTLPAFRLKLININHIMYFNSFPK